MVMLQDGLTFGAEVTEVLAGLVHPFTVCVTVYVPDVVTTRGLPLPPSLHASVPV